MGQREVWFGRIAAVGLLAAGVGTLTNTTDDPYPASAGYGYRNCDELVAAVRPRVLEAAAAQVRAGSGPAPTDPMFDATGIAGPTRTDIVVPARPIGVDGTRLVRLRRPDLLEVIDLTDRSGRRRATLQLGGLRGSELLVLPNHRVLVLGSASGGLPDAALLLVDTSDPMRPVLRQSAVLTGALGPAWLEPHGVVRLALAGRPAGLRGRDGGAPRPFDWTLDRTATAADLLPRIEVRDPNGATLTGRPLVDCGAVWLPDADSGAGLFTVASFAGDGDGLLASGRGSAVLGHGTHVEPVDEYSAVLATRRPGDLTSTQLDQIGLAQTGTSDGLCCSPLQRADSGGLPGEATAVVFTGRSAWVFTRNDLAGAVEHRVTEVAADYTSTRRSLALEAADSRAAALTPFGWETIVTVGTPDGNSATYRLDEGAPPGVGAGSPLLTSADAQQFVVLPNLKTRPAATPSYARAKVLALRSDAKGALMASVLFARDDGGRFDDAVPYFHRVHSGPIDRIADDVVVTGRFGRYVVGPDKVVVAAERACRAVRGCTPGPVLLSLAVARDRTVATLGRIDLDDEVREVFAMGKDVLVVTTTEALVLTPALTVRHRVALGRP